MHKPTKNQNLPLASNAHEPVDASDKKQAIEVEMPIDKKVDQRPREVNGPKGLEPTRYGDWEANGRCYDF